MKVPIKRKISQVADGLAYKGELSIADTKFTYELNYPRPISEWDDMPEIKEKDEILKFFAISLKKDDQEIVLTHDDLGLFFQLLIVFSVEFYNNDQTRRNNDGPLGDFVRGTDDIMSGVGASMSIGMESDVTWDFPDEAIQMLRSPKFGISF